MKVLSTLLPLLALSESDEIGEKKLSETMKMVYDQVTTTLDFQTFTNRLQNYGCHCFPNNSRIPGGKGEWQNPVDLACKRLAQCNQCVGLDHADFVDAQDKYRWETVNGAIDCSANNEDDKRDHCQCDKEFALQMGMVWNDNDFDTSVWFNRRNQDAQVYDDVCVQNVVNPPTSEKECCGENPKRRPYNVDVFECCQDGSIRINCP